ncbi:ATP-binding protein [Actinokineospora diospyrosa]|uniref:ATPase family associated with various cellular activities (AAA) n=1 Tax=Actinokineospora diospyrosa TaxID=103728 RepID=A0ABT1IFZ8_9PSEU|nr:ATP-binding protein [Actinokineospora diospyrosa]MCP2271476.1 ATPase family associated with various cellular activities (AAA) [Actinokineospora diospyrosa]
MTDTSVVHLFDRLAALEQRIRDAVALRRAGDPNPDDPFRGLYLSEEAIDALFAESRSPFPLPGDLDPSGLSDRLTTLVPLSPLDTELLLIAVAPDIDSRFEQFYGYLNDDVTRRRASVGLALRLCGVPEASAPARARLDADAPLITSGLLVVDDRDRPLLSRSLRVPDRVVAHLLGDTRMDPGITGFASLATELDTLPGTDLLARAFLGGVRSIYLREHPGCGARETAAAALGEAGFAALIVDTHRLPPDYPDDTARALLREALLRGAGIIIGPIDVNGTPLPLGKLSHPAVPTVLHGTSVWDPGWSLTPPVQHDVRPLPVATRTAIWRACLAGKLAPDADPAAVTAHFVLGPGQIRHAAYAAELAAVSSGGLVRAEHLRAGARGQNAAGLHRLARRIEPTVGWDDLVLPAPVMAGLRELAARARHRDRVLDEWRMRPGGGRGRGVTGLMAGDSGTGKTMSAEVIARALGMDLYTVNLATVVDKYVGETEKNLERIFAEAAGVNGVLLFDEADAIFGKRSEVRDAHDRYANIESAYLLQRMETFEGIALLSTNLRANLDEAFTRRLDVVVDFPVPDEALRRRLWDRCLGTAVPRGDDLDLDFLADSFELAGGHIRSAAITAAYLAADSDEPVSMARLVGAVAREYRKLGRLCLEREFGPYHEIALIV